MAQTVRQLMKDLEEIIALKPEALDYPIIYSIDDEGNAYHKVVNNAALTQVHDVHDYYLELVGFLNDESEEEENRIDIRDCNCVIIN